MSILDIDDIEHETNLILNESQLNSTDYINN